MATEMVRKARKAHNAKYHAEHKEEINARSARYHAEHKEEIKARKARYRVEHKEEIKARKAQYCTDHKEEIRAYETQYRANCSAEVKARRAARQAGYYAEHKEELGAYAAQYYADHRDEAAQYYVDNRDEIRAYNARYHAEHGDEIRARKVAYSQTDAGQALNRAKSMRRRAQQGGEVSAAVILEVTAEYGGLCPYCNQQITEGHVDHIVPVSNGGTNDRDNLVYACASCNLSKGDKSLLEFLIYRRNIALGA